MVAPVVRVRQAGIASMGLPQAPVTPMASNAIDKARPMGLALALVLGSQLPASALAQSGAAHADDGVDLAGFRSCLQGLRGDAAERGVQRATFDELTAGLTPDMSVIDLLNYQPEFRAPVWDYLAGLVDEERVLSGQMMALRHAGLLERIEAEYGVSRHVVLSVWGVESNYGQNYGNRPLLTSLSTLSCFGRRQPFFRGEFMTTLRIVQDGHIGADELVGSWAGAFGHTQFMPSTFQRIAVDFDGDGRRDLIGSVPDALASTANYLKQSNWRTGERWGFEVKVPQGFNADSAERRSKQPVSAWAARGVRRVDGSALEGSDAPGARQAAIILPAGVDGPAFMTFRNFDAIFSYNPSVNYALAIALLSDQIAGGAGIQAAWPTDDPPISRVERRELQQLLLDRGHDIGAVDGIIGARSREAVKLEQQRLGHEASGRAGMKILEALRAEPVATRNGVANEAVDAGAADEPGGD